MLTVVEERGVNRLIVHPVAISYDREPPFGALALIVLAVRSRAYSRAICAVVRGGLLAYLMMR